ncbi:MAG: TMEM175 family protein [Gordonia sp. (in: high G+C Gram-positive bacteria)]
MSAEPDSSSAAARTAVESAEEYFPEDSNEFGRGVSFFDAVYGFAATLLIANLDAPPAEAWRDFDALLDSGIVDQLLGFVLSFAVIALFWRVNVRLTKNLRAMDGPTISANLVASGLVIVIPFTTQGISDPASNGYALPTALYSLNIALAALAQSAVALIARRRGLEIDPPTGRANVLGIVDALLTPVVFGLSIPIALTLGPAAAQWSWALLLVLLPISRKLASQP